MPALCERERNTENKADTVVWNGDEDKVRPLNRQTGTSLKEPGRVQG